jgi:hypothetical protein
MRKRALARFYLVFTVATGQPVEEVCMRFAVPHLFVCVVTVVDKVWNGELLVGEQYAYGTTPYAQEER